MEEESKILVFLLDEDQAFILLCTDWISSNRITVSSTDWFSRAIPLYDNIQFRCTFRMSRSCFQMLKDIFFHEANITETTKNLTSFSMLIYYSMYNISYRALAEKFGVKTTTAYRTIQKMLKQFNSLLGPIYIRLPLPSEFSSLASAFRMISSIDGTILAVDGTHIPIEAPKNMDGAYINRKGWYSINFQVAVDSNCIVRNIFGGFPGSCHDAHLYRLSSFKEYVDNVITAPFFAIGDATYLSSQTPKVPFKGLLTPEMERWNNRLSAQRMRVEMTFGRVKGKFKRFMMQAKNGELSTVVGLLYFACIVHNIIELFKLNSAEDFYLEYQANVNNDNIYSDEELP